MSERMTEEDDMDMGGAAARSMGRLAADLADEVAALTTQLRAQDEALGLARKALKKAKGQLETLWDLSPGHEDEGCPEDDTCECGNVAEFTEAHEATSSALAAIEKAENTQPQALNQETPMPATKRLYIVTVPILTKKPRAEGLFQVATSPERAKAIVAKDMELMKTCRTISRKASEDADTYTVRRATDEEIQEHFLAGHSIE